MGGGGGARLQGDVGDIFGDIFSDIFGGMGGGRGRARRGSDLRYLIELDLEEAVFGVEKQIEVPTLVECEPCSGSGSDRRQDLRPARPAAATAACACRTASSRSSRRARIAPAAARSSPIRAATAAAKAACMTSARLSVKIPAGVDTGDRIRLTGQGEAGPTGTVPGDLYVEVRVREHAIFQREGDDLHCEIPIRFAQAALGAELKVPTLDGEAASRFRRRRRPASCSGCAARASSPCAAAHAAT